MAMSANIQEILKKYDVKLFEFFEREPAHYVLRTDAPMDLQLMFDVKAQLHPANKLTFEQITEAEKAQMALPGIEEKPGLPPLPLISLIGVWTEIDITNGDGLTETRTVFIPEQHLKLFVKQLDSETFIYAVQS